MKLYFNDAEKTIDSERERERERESPYTCTVDRGSKVCGVGGGGDGIPDSCEIDTTSKRW